MVSGSVRLRSVFVGEKLLFSSLSAHQSQSRSQQPRYETPPNKETREIAPTQSCWTEPPGSGREDNLLMIIIDNFPSQVSPLPPPPSLSLTRLAADQAEDESCPVSTSYKSITCQSNINLTSLQHKYWPAPSSPTTTRQETSNYHQLPADSRKHLN